MRGNTENKTDTSFKLSNMNEKCGEKYNLKKSVCKIIECNICYTWS